MRVWRPGEMVIMVSTPRTPIKERLGTCWYLKNSSGYKTWQHVRFWHVSSHAQLLHNVQSKCTTHNTLQFIDLAITKSWLQYWQDSQILQQVAQNTRLYFEFKIFLAKKLITQGQTYQQDLRIKNRIPLQKSRKGGPIQEMSQKAIQEISRNQENEAPFRKSLEIEKNEPYPRNFLKSRKRKPCPGNL